MLTRVLLVLQTTQPAEEAVQRITSLTEWVRSINWIAVATRLITALLVIVVAFLASRVARRGVRRWVSGATARGLGKTGDARAARAELRATTLGDVMADAVSVVIWFLAVVTALGQIGVDLRALLAGAGIAGIAIGFGAQNLVKDFFSGFFILLEDQYGVGDVITVDEQGQVGGIVEDISLRMTRLRSLDGTVWFVPNGEIRYLGNRSKEWARALVDFDVAYGENPTDVMAVIREVAAHLRRDDEIGPKILEDVEILGVERLGESGITIRTFIKTLPLEQWAVSRRFRQEVKQAFDELGIEIPFPHRKLIIEDGSRSRPAAPTPRSRRSTS
ncbi:MAG TPA: mechanosensitive ion channel family protein [Nitriliruptorales bacterium]|nr:mechanosensitive ion channel family protein [Nitriliruptorales bacterium]